MFLLFCLLSRKFKTGGDCTCFMLVRDDFPIIQLSVLSSCLQMCEVPFDSFVGAKPNLFFFLVLFFYLCAVGGYCVIYDFLFFDFLTLFFFFFTIRCKLFSTLVCSHHFFFFGQTKFPNFYRSNSNTHTHKPNKKKQSM